MFIHDTPAAFYGRGIKIEDDILEKWFADFQGNLVDFQTYLLNETFDNPLFACWSLRIKYRQTFLKTILAWIEKQDRNQVDSRWYDLIVEYTNRSSNDQDWCHTVYILDNNQTVIHRQTTAMLSQGLTGLSSWPAAICLGDYLMQRIDLVENKKIVELGAGSGLLGLALLKSSERIPSYTFTDYSPMILNLLMQNASLNFSDEELERRMKIEELDWNQFSSVENNYDLILAADVVYDPSVIDSLVKTISILLESNRTCVAYVANAIRNPTTYDQFLQCLKSRSDLFRIESIEKDECQSIEILRLSCFIFENNSTKFS